MTPNQTTDELARRIAKQITGKFASTPDKLKTLDEVEQVIFAELRELVADKERLDWLASVDIVKFWQNENNYMTRLAIDQAMKGK